MWEGEAMHGYGGYGGNRVQEGGEDGDSLDDAMEGSAPMDTFDPSDELQVRTVEQLLSDPRGAAPDDVHVEYEVAPGPRALPQRDTGKRAAQQSASSESDKSQSSAKAAKAAKATRKRPPRGAGWTTVAFNKRKVRRAAAYAAVEANPVGSGQQNAEVDD